MLHKLCSITTVLVLASFFQIIPTTASLYGQKSIFFQALAPGQRYLVTRFANDLKPYRQQFKNCTVFSVFSVIRSLNMTISRLTASKYTSGMRISSHENPIV